MAGSRFEYVRKFELPDPLLPGTFMVLRIDGHAFHRLTEDHGFTKPNDERALQLMDHAARDVMNEFKDIVLAFGESDEHSFLFRKSADVYNRRQAKILTNAVSLFTSSYVFNWSKYLPSSPLKYAPIFDGRIVLYPSQKEVKDYFAWRQADTHVNNLYNTIFWALIQQGGKTTTEAHAALRGTVSSQKHEMLFTQFDINYNSLPARYRKGSILVRETVAVPDGNLDESLEAGDTIALTASASIPPRRKKSNKKAEYSIRLHHCDIIGEDFWELRPHLLSDK